MKPLWGLAMSAGLFLCATAANAQTPYQVAGSPYTSVSDVSGPYGGMPPEAAGPGYGYGPPLMPPREVYTVLRDNGFSPLGIPQQRGFFYRIAVVDRRGDDGRLVIDARDGRIVRFTPAYEIGNRYEEYSYGAPPGPLPPMANLRGVPRPPASVPHVASRAPIPKPSPLAAKPDVALRQQSASIAAKPAEAPPPAAPAPVQAKPAAPQIAPTQPMPKVQGLE